MSKATITEINKDTFWELIAQAKEHPGGPSEWLMEQLMDLGPEQAKKFDDIACAYTSLAYQYGLWTAASVMERGGCTDDGFIDFRGWLIAQGREVYMAALKDPDSLADAPDYCRFAVDAGYIPIAPHLYFPRFMDDANPRERDLALFMDIVLLTKCAQLWVFGETISKGMGIEIEKAKRKGQTIRYFTENCQEVSV